MLCEEGAVHSLLTQRFPPQPSLNAWKLSIAVKRAVRGDIALPSHWVQPTAQMG